MYNKHVRLRRIGNFLRYINTYKPMTRQSTAKYLKRVEIGYDKARKSEKVEKG